MPLHENGADISVCPHWGIELSGGSPSPPGVFAAGEVAGLFDRYLMEMTEQPYS